MKRTVFIMLLIGGLGCSHLLLAQETNQSDAAELAKKLSNPIASLISVPLQNNTDLGIGANGGSRNTLNIQPVVPLSLTEDINLIVRWVQPVISQYNVTGSGKHESGLGDAVVSAFFSPAEAKNGLTWGVGPVLLVPTGTNDYLTAKKLGIGPTAVALYQANGMTFGALVNQVWSIAGDKDRSDLSSMFFQPFFTYNWKSGAGIGANFEVTQNWKGNTTTVWLNPILTAVTSLGKQKTQFLFGPRLNLAAPDGGKADFGVRAGVVFLFPK
ncbi:transporter family protein [Mangrovibacterium lignilyticum]|uniref:hypothetical protein n=1 Tax=Mangrovibacterium lignilyticum TaxID=2668052 RepID=UPI001967D5B1|nr:hypothetical protein [Mangrovibacterium lignilyticum]